MKKISDVIPFVPVPSPEKPVPALSKRQRQIIDLSGAIAEQTREEANELGFMSRLLLMANLPYRDPGLEKRVWVRQNGKVSVIIAPAFDKHGVSLGIPYGTYPRLILAYLVTQAVKTRSPVIYLGKSFGNFLKTLNVNDGGNQYKQFQKQLQRTLSASFSWTYEKEEMESRINIHVSDQSQLWWQPKQTNVHPLWENWIELNHHFFNEIVRNAVPLDLRALSVLKNSPLALDLYMFVLWRIYKLKKPVYISWDSLQQQLGGQYADIKEFARDCRMHIKRIKAIHPKLNISFVKGRICLRLSF